MSAIIPRKTTAVFDFFTALETRHELGKVPGNERKIIRLT